MKRHEGERSTERIITWSENMGNENFMCRPHIGKRLKKKKEIKIITNMTFLTVRLLHGLNSIEVVPLFVQHCWPNP